MWLFDILQNGILVDNQSYFVNDGVLMNRRFSESVHLSSREYKQKGQIWNREGEIWNFLNTVSRDIEKILNRNMADALILFNDEEYEHNTDAGFITVSGTDARNFSLKTENLIGFVKHGDYSLKISSRFGDAFLQYIIADADGFLELENIGGESRGSGYEWLLAYLWNIKFKRAYRLGLPKTYRSKIERVSRVRGKIDAVDYFRNTGSGKYLCSFREHSYDSPAVSLFIKAYETIENQPYNVFVQGTRNIYNAFLMANQGVKRSRQEVLGTPYFPNPFYNDYNVLIDLSKQVISHQGSDFDSKNDSSAFFFDISMLFEYFIRKLLKRNGIRLLSKYELRHEITAGAPGGYKRKLEPDLVFENNSGIFVFDVKYKTFDPRFGIKREDLFQLHTYLGQYGNGAPVSGCGFIFPVSEVKWIELNLDQSDGMISDTVEQHGKKIPFHVLFLKIPDNKATDFNRLMNEQCRIFMDEFQENVLCTVPF
ncbi:MAG: restriction endonuclease [Bacteroidales bacterium]|nr:restriction endonuclease [Bacteroidales bacterium]